MWALVALREHPEEIEADLLEHFGIDVLDMWRGRLSLRRVAVLLKSLLDKPGHSAFAAVMNESFEWSTSDFLLARISDALEASNFLYLQAHVTDGERRALTPPEPLPRPGSAPTSPQPRTHFASGDEVADFFSHMNSL